MTRTEPRPALLTPGLMFFLVGVLVIDALAVGGVVFRMWQGRLANDWLSFYAAGTLVRTGSAAHLYDPAAQSAVQHVVAGADFKAVGYPLPVAVALALAPLSRLSFAASYTVWLAINVLTLAVLLRLSWGWLAGVPEGLRAVFLACAVSVAALNVLMQGQIDLLVLAGFAGCYALLRAERPFSAGAVLALALCKPHLAAAVVLLLIVKRQWRALAGLASAGAPFLLAPALVLSPRLLVEQLRLVLSYTHTATNYDVNAAMMINIRGTVTSITSSSNIWLWLPLLAFIAAVSIAIAMRVWAGRPALHPQSWALAFMLPLLYSPHLHMQTIVLLVPAAALYLVASQSSAYPLVEIKRVLFPLVAMTMLWSLNLAGVSLMAFLVLAAYTLFARRWPESVSQQAVALQQPAAQLALVS